MPVALFVLTQTSFFLSHFQPVANAAKKAGYKVVVAAPPSDRTTDITKLDIEYIPLALARSSMNPLTIMASALDLNRVIRTVNPDVVHAIALPSIVITALADRISSNKRHLVLAPTGLGHLWIETGIKTRAARETVRLLLSIAAKRQGAHFLFENNEDPIEFGLSESSPNLTIIGGAGVNATEFSAQAAPQEKPFRIAVVARMTEPKGIRTAVEAVRSLYSSGLNIQIDLYGMPDPGNRRSLSTETLNEWNKSPEICWHGQTTDIQSVWQNSHVAMLLSWREGLPRSLVEAMACGRAVIASDVIGCRAVIRDGIEGVLVPPEDPSETSNAIRKLYENPSLRKKMEQNARQRFEKNFTAEIVEEQVTTLYQSFAQDFK